MTATRWASSILLSTLLVSCSGKKKSEPAEQPPPAPAEVAQPEPAPDDPLELWQRYAEAAKARDVTALAGLYTTDAVAVPVGSGATAIGPDQIVEFLSTFWNGFPDMTTDTYVVVSNGDTIAAVNRVRGTHTKPMMGLPATNKQTSFFGLEILHLGDAGRIARQELYADNLSFLAQLGMWGGPHRAYDDSEPPALRTARTADTDGERANLEVVRAAIDAFNAHDVRALAALYAPDALISNQAGSADYRGDQAKAAYSGFFAAFSDAQKSDHSAWAAGDWVVSTYRLGATHTGPLGRLDLDKPTGKKIDVEVGEVYRIADGKIAEHWIFADGMVMAAQLGALDVPAK